MGYNNRAVRLHKLAHVIIHIHGGRFPRDYQSLVALPGVGRYTANAILSSAFKIDVPTVDVNVRRFLSRAFWKMSSTRELHSEQDIWRLAEELLPRGESYQWNQALMDIGATICTLRAPRCEICPAASFCKSKQSMKETNATKPKREPSFSGVPNRIYRGRIIEELRRRNGTGSISIRKLGPRVHPNFSSRHSKWLESILKSLQRDGLILIQGNGSPTRQRVRLA
jgi:A/G-specific adenine glycosylase